MLANEKVVVPLLKFLKAAEVEEKKAAREQEKEWKQRNDQAGEKSLVYE